MPLHAQPRAKAGVKAERPIHRVDRDVDVLAKISEHKGNCRKLAQILKDKGQPVARVVMDRIWGQIPRRHRPGLRPMR
jgi:hypothetical protein